MVMVNVLSSVVILTVLFLKVMNDLNEILPFVNELCTTLVLPPTPSVEK